MQSKRKRYSITLLEIMIVILLIGLIGGVLSYNLKGTLERGKAFRTEQGIKRLKEILELEIQQGHAHINQLTGPHAYDNVKKCVVDSGLISSKEVDKFLKDGWGELYYYTEDAAGEIAIHSHHLEKYQEKHPGSI